MNKVTALPAAILKDPRFLYLSPKQQAFLLHPDMVLDPIKAAREVGYSDSYAQRDGHRMRRDLMQYLTPLLEDRLAALSVTASRIRDELAVRAFAKITDFFELVDVPDGNEGYRTVKVFRDPTLLPEHMQRAVKRVSFSNEVSEDGSSQQIVTDIELHDHDRAMNLLAEVMGLKDRTRRLDDDDVNEDEVAMLESLEPDELELVQRLYKKAAARIDVIRNKKEDARAIPGTAVEVKGKRDAKT